MDSNACACTNSAILPSLTSPRDYCTNYRATCSKLKQTHTHAHACLILSVWHFGFSVTLSDTSLVIELDCAQLLY